MSLARGRGRRVANGRVRDVGLKLINVLRDY